MIIGTFFVIVLEIVVYLYLYRLTGDEDPVSWLFLRMIINLFYANILLCTISFIIDCDFSFWDDILQVLRNLLDCAKRLF